jgi:hypothetical protein
MSRAALDEIEILSEDEGENGCDYTLIHRGSAQGEKSTARSPSPNEDNAPRNSPRLGDFKCSQCLKTIDVGRPIYMRNDFPYCSKECRELGVSSVYKMIFGSSVDKDAGFVSRILRQIGGSSSASVSSMEDTEDEFGAPTNAGVASAARARAKSFLKSIVGSMSKTSLGSSFIRTYSNSVIWGKDMTRNTSFNMLFSYLPEVSDERIDTQSSTPKP